MKRIFALFLLLAIAAAPVSANDAVLTKLKDTVDRVLKVLYADGGVAKEQRTQAVREAIGDTFSFYAISRRALARNWDKLSAEQQAEFPELFTDLLVNTYADRYDGDTPPKVEWGSVTDLNAKRKEVASTIYINGQPAEVLYRLALTDDSWQVYDIIAEGISLISNYRQQFDSIIQREGVDALMESLRNKSTPSQ